MQNRTIGRFYLFGKAILLTLDDNPIADNLNIALSRRIAKSYLLEDTFVCLNCVNPGRLSGQIHGNIREVALDIWRRILGGQLMMVPFGCW